MAQVSINPREQKTATLKRLVAEMMKEMLDDLIADCKSGKRIAAETWLQDAAASDYLLRYGEGEIAAYEDIIGRLEEWQDYLNDSLPPAK